MVDSVEGTTPRLAADETVGRLVRWLRLLGYDTVQVKGESQAAILRAARGENRLVVTRRTALARQAGLRALILRQTDLQSQIDTVREFCGTPEAGQTRCPECNEPLKEIERDAARGKVPPYVWRSEQQFSRCEQCGRVFWPGTHWEAVKEVLNIPTEIDEG